MTWTPKGSDLGPRWVSIRRKVLRDSAGICASCGGDGATEVDHIIPRHRGGSNELSNLRALCRTCHGKKSSAEGHAQKNKLRQSRKRPAVRHPGMP